jgi:hypothetical protein
MRSSWPLLLSILLVIGGFIMIQEEASAVEASLEEDEYYVSVDPSDDYQGYLEIKGEVDPGNLGIGQTMTITLTVDVHEIRNGEPTGRMWDASIEYDDIGSPGGSKIFNSRDGAEGFTVLLDPAINDPGNPEGKIPIPPGIGEETEGRVVVTASYSGVNVEEGEIKTQATIYPELYHLVNMTTPSSDVRLEASDRLTYTITIKNAGNLEETVNLEVPVLDDLEELGFETSLSDYRFTALLPGERRNSTLDIKAPLEIKRDDTMTILIHSYTEALDPDSLQPASENEISIKLDLVKSKIEKPQGGDDDDTSDDDDDGPGGFEPSPSPGIDPVAAEEGSETWLVVVIIGFIVVAIIIIAVVFFRNGGGGEEEDISEAHDSTFRI